MVGVKDKVMHHFKTNTAKDYSKQKRVNNVYRRGRKKNTQKNNNTKDNPKTVSLKILEIFLR